MTRPDPAATGVAGLCAAVSVVFVLNRWYLPAGIAAGIAAAILRMFWHVPLCDENGNDIEALVKATREDIPDYIPAEWLEEFQ